MDKKIAMTVAVAFLLLIITMTIKAQISSIQSSAELSQEMVADTTRSAATVLHIRGNSQDYEFGKIGRDEFEDIMYNCGSNSGLAALNGDIKVARESSLDSCVSETHVYDYWAENGLLSGIVVLEEDGSEQLEWVVVS